MSTIAIVSITGWMLVVLVAGTVWLPYLVRNRLLAGGVRRPYRLRLRPHYVIGYALTAVAGAHTIASIANGSAGASIGAGIAAAAVGLGLILAQVVIGLCLFDPGDFRRPLRTWHLASAYGIGAAIIIHTALNSPTIANLIAR